MPMFCLFILLTTLVPLTGNPILPSDKDPTLIKGCVSIGRNISMHATEVTLQEYCEFVIANDYDHMLYPDYSALTDPSYIWFFEHIKTEKDLAALGRKFFQEHHGSLRKPVFVPLNFPMVGVTYEQALRFCAWKETDVNRDRSDDKKIKISLASIELYRTVIENVDSFLKSRTPQPCRSPAFNYKVSFCLPKGWTAEERGHDLVRADGYWPTQKGLYGLEGNAAEMTSTEGIAIGGSFRQYASECTSDHEQSYSGPQDWLGFRYQVTLR